MLKNWFRLQALSQLRDEPEKEDLDFTLEQLRSAMCFRSF